MIVWRSFHRSYVAQFSFFLLSRNSPVFLKKLFAVLPPLKQSLLLHWKLSVNAWTGRQTSPMCCFQFSVPSEHWKKSFIWPFWSTCSVRFDSGPHGYRTVPRRAIFSFFLMVIFPPGSYFSDDDFHHPATVISMSFSHISSSFRRSVFGSVAIGGRRSMSMIFGSKGYVCVVCTMTIHRHGPVDWRTVSQISSYIGSNCSNNGHMITVHGKNGTYRASALIATAKHLKPAEVGQPDVEIRSTAFWKSWNRVPWGLLCMCYLFADKSPSQIQNTYNKAKVALSVVLEN